VTSSSPAGDISGHAGQVVDAGVPVVPLRDAEVDAAQHEYVKLLVRLSPESATALGLHDHDAELDTREPAAWNALIELEIAFLRKLDADFAGARLSRRAQTDLALMQHQLRVDIRRKREELPLVRRPDLYAPGLAALGLDPARLLVVAARRAEEVLWTMEEALGCRGLGAVVGEGASPDLTASRRLQLAAEGGGVPALLIAAGGGAPRTSAAVTRWQVDPAPGASDEPGLGPIRWRLSLVRCRGGRPGEWTVDLRDGRLDPVGEVATAEGVSMRRAAV
jgi:hypothetical protein